MKLVPVEVERECGQQWGVKVLWMVLCTLSYMEKKGPFSDVELRTYYKLFDSCTVLEQIATYLM